MKKILVINGPNLGLLGRREPDIYGADTLSDIMGAVRAEAAKLGFELEAFQSDVEGELVSRIGRTLDEPETVGILINPAAYTHTSVALRDALAAAGRPAVEVHLSNVASREEFRRQSFTAPVCLGTITGMGGYGYILALFGLARHLAAADGLRRKQHKDSTLK